MATAATVTRVPAERRSGAHSSDRACWAEPARHGRGESARRRRLGPRFPRRGDAGSRQRRAREPRSPMNVRPRLRAGRASRYSHSAAEVLTETGPNVTIGRVVHGLDAGGRLRVPSQAQGHARARAHTHTVGDAAYSSARSDSPARKVLLVRRRRVPAPEADRVKIRLRVFRHDVVLGSQSPSSGHRPAFMVVGG